MTYYSTATINDEFQYKSCIVRSGGEGEARIIKFRMSLDEIRKGLFVVYDCHISSGKNDVEGKLCMEGVKKFYCLSKFPETLSALRTLVFAIQDEIVRLSSNKDISNAISSDPVVQSCLKKFTISLPV